MCMTRWYYRNIYEELEDMRDYIDSLFQQIQETSPIALLPTSQSGMKLLPGVQDNFRVTVIESDDEVVVTVEMVPGYLKKDITIDLLHSKALKISCEHRECKQEETMQYFQCEESFKSFTQIVPLLKPVTDEGSNASFRDNVLEVHLKKAVEDPSQ